MIEALGYEEAAKKEKDGHGYIGASDAIAGKPLERVLVAIAIAMGKDDEDGRRQPEKVEIIAFSFVQVVAQTPARGEPFTV